MNRTMFIGTELYYSQDFVDDRNKEIERLNNIINKAINYLYRDDLDIRDEWLKDIIIEILKGDKE